MQNILIFSAQPWHDLCFKTPPPKCQDCRQYMDDSDLKFFQGDPDNAVSECCFKKLLKRKTCEISILYTDFFGSFTQRFVLFSAGRTRNANRWAAVLVWFKWGWIWELWGFAPTQDYKLQVRDYLSLLHMAHLPSSKEQACFFTLCVAEHKVL